MREYILTIISYCLLLFMTFIFALFGLNMSLPPSLSLVQEHLIVSIFVYLILFVISFILSYKRYFRYRNPKVVYKIIKTVRDFFARREIDGIYGDDENLRSKNKDVQIAIDNLRNGHLEIKKAALVQLKQMLSDSDPAGQISIARDLINSICYEKDEAIRILIIKEVCKTIKNKSDKVLLSNQV
jgi:hypothetical protein